MTAPVIASYGMGQNSTAMLIRWVRRGLPLHLILAADTGDESPATYRYRDEVMAPWLAANGAPPITVVRWIRRDGSFESIGENCLRTRSLPSQAYGLKGCTSKWKTQPLDKAVDSDPAVAACRAKGQRVIRLVGYHALERRRIERRRESDVTDPLNEWRYPLAEEGIDPDGCREIIESEGLPIPPHSWCRFCPNKLQRDVLRMREDDPDGLAYALRIESNAIIDSPSILGLGRYSFSWAGLLASDAAQQRMFFASAADDEEAMPCGCADGGAA